MKHIWMVLADLRYKALAFCFGFFLALDFCALFYIDRGRSFGLDVQMNIKDIKDAQECFVSG